MKPLSSPAPSVSPGLIVDLANAFFGSCILFTASDVGVFRRLAEQDGMDSASLARDLQQSERGMRALMDASVAVGLLLKNGERYSLTPAARKFLTPGSPADLSGALRYNRDVYSAWGRLAEFVRTGQPVERPELHLGEDRERTRAFVMAMHDKAVGMGRAILPWLDLAGRKRLLDVGGGPGTIAVLIAQAFPEIHCTVLDLPAVVDVAAGINRAARRYRACRYPGGRLSHHAIPFRPRRPQLLRHAAPGIARGHPQPDRQSATQRLEPGGVIHVMDMMTDDSHTQPPFSAIFALTMGLTTQYGWVFSARRATRLAGRGRFYRLQRSAAALRPYRTGWRGRGNHEPFSERLRSQCFGFIPRFKHFRRSRMSFYFCDVQVLCHISANYPIGLWLATAHNQLSASRYHADNYLEDGILDAISTILHRHRKRLRTGDQRLHFWVRDRTHPTGRSMGRP